MKKGVLRNFPKFTGKRLYQCLRPATLLKKETLAQAFSLLLTKDCGDFRQISLLIIKKI